MGTTYNPRGKLEIPVEVSLELTGPRHERGVSSRNEDQERGARFAARSMPASGAVEHRLGKKSGPSGRESRDTHTHTHT
eukprot:7450857-Pyramimonas_sp.AAC.1